MTAENTAIGMNFINHNVFQIFKQLYPFGVMGKDVGMEHIWIGDYNVSSLTDRFTSRALCIAVIGICLDVDAELLNHFIQAADLIGRERFCGKEIQRTGILVLENRGYNRKIVA